MTELDGVNPEVAPSGKGCAECLAAEGWWFHLRRCAECGHIGCCDSSPDQHATAHATASGYAVICSFEPGEVWFYRYTDEAFLESGPALAAPEQHPLDQPAPAPAHRVPADRQRHLHWPDPSRPSHRGSPTVARGPGVMRQRCETRRRTAGDHPAGRSLRPGPELPAVKLIVVRRVGHSCRETALSTT